MGFRIAAIDLVIICIIVSPQGEFRGLHAIAAVHNACILQQVSHVDIFAASGSIGNFGNLGLLVVLAKEYRNLAIDVQDFGPV